MRAWLVSVALGVVVIGGLGAYILTAPLPPIIHIVGDHVAGSALLSLASVRPFQVGESIIVKAGENVAIVTIAGLDVRASTVSLASPLAFEVHPDSDSIVASSRFATLAAVFDGRRPIRRFPRTDSRAFGTSQAGLWKEIRLLTPGWVKIAIGPAEEGWVWSAHAAVDEEGVVPEAVFRQRVPVRRRPYEDEALIRWEGRVTSKETATDNGDGKTHTIAVTNQNGVLRRISVPQATWSQLAEWDYVISRDGKPIRELPVPVAFTDRGPPYEVLDRQPRWIKIQLRDQGWVERGDCRVEVRYTYNPGRRQIAKRILADALGRLRRALW